VFSALCARNSHDNTQLNTPTVVDSDIDTPATLRSAAAALTVKALTNDALDHVTSAVGVGVEWKTLEAADHVRSLQRYVIVISCCCFYFVLFLSA
jgi:hypothetical protein